MITFDQATVDSSGAEAFHKKRESISQKARKKKQNITE